MGRVQWCHFADEPTAVRHERKLHADLRSCTKCAIGDEVEPPTCNVTDAQNQSLSREEQDDVVNCEGVDVPPFVWEREAANSESGAASESGVPTGDACEHDVRGEALDTWRAEALELRRDLARLKLQVERGLNEQELCVLKVKELDTSWASLRFDAQKAAAEVSEVHQMQIALQGQLSVHGQELSDARRAFDLAAREWEERCDLEILQGQMEAETRDREIACEALQQALIDMQDTMQDASMGTVSLEKILAELNVQAVAFTKLRDDCIEAVQREIRARTEKDVLLQEALEHERRFRSESLTSIQSVLEELQTGLECHTHELHLEGLPPFMADQTHVGDLHSTRRMSGKRRDVTRMRR